MPRYTRTPYQKLETKINNIVVDALTDTEDSIQFDGNILMNYSETQVEYTNYRYYGNRVDSLVEDNYSVIVPLSHENLKYITGTSPNPPKFTNNIIKLFRENGHEVATIIIGAENNGLNGNVISITGELYDDLYTINSEEGRTKQVRFKNRVSPFFQDYFNIAIENEDEERDYGTLMREVIASGQVTQADIQELSNQLEVGRINNVVIQRQVNRQVEWLIQTVENILDEDNLNVAQSKRVGSAQFGYTQVSVTGPEHLMEKILTDYGQFSLFGVPALINTNKYAIYQHGRLPRSQFDILLINHLGEVEVVELKRPDKVLLDFNEGRNKFFASEDLSIAIAQTERYLSAILNGNDPELRIDGQTISDFLIQEVGGLIHVESIRPTGLIIMGSSSKICKNYEDQPQSVRDRVTRANYLENAQRAYRELKDSHKNIKIINYSELLENARMRLQLFREQEEEE